MPGNGGVDRVHNFFGQDNTNQSQHHSQVVDVNWQALGKNLCVGNQRRTAASSYPKNFTVQQLVPDSERVHGNHSSLLPHGMNSSQSNLRPDFSSKSWSHVQQPNLNGYVFGNQAFQTRPNEMNILGVDTESDRHIATSRGLSMFELQHGNAPEQHDKNLFRSENTESPVNYDFLGSQQQMNGQQLGMMQSVQRQQSGFGDMQLLQQQVMLKQMQEFQRQQQLQQLEARRQCSMDQMLSVAKQASSNHPSSLVNATTSHDTPNYVWPSEVVAGNTIWQHRGASPAVLGSSNDLMVSPDQGQALRLVPQQVDQSLYGFPVSDTRGTLNQYSHIEMDKSTSNQMTVSGNSIPGNQSQFSDQDGLRDGSLVSRQASNAKNLSRRGSSDGFNSSLLKENFQLTDAQEKVSSLQELHETHDLVGTSEAVNEKRGMHTAASANVVALDPTEEKILFGTDDNHIWEVFGGSIGGSNLLDGVNAFPSLQSGSWSALMQSAVAETSSGDVGSQEWSGAGFHNELPARNRLSSTFRDGGRQPMFGTDTKMVSSSNYRTPISNDVTMATNNCSLVEFPHPGTQFLNEESDRLQSGPNSSVPQSMDGSKWLDCHLPEKNRAEGSQIGQTGVHGSVVELNPKSISNAWKQDESFSSYNNVSQQFRKFSGWNDSTSRSPSENANMTIRERESPQTSGASNLKRSIHEEMGHGGGPWRDNSASNSASESEHMKSGWMVNPRSLRLSNAPALLNSGTIKETLQNAHQLSSDHQFDLLKGAEALAKQRGNEEIGKSPHNLNQGPNVLESLQNNVDKGAAERYEIDRNCDRKENSSDSRRSNSSLHASASGPRENNWLDASNSHALTGKQKSSGQVGRKPTRKFQYHPMGNLDADVEPSYAAKHITNLQALPQQFPGGFRSHEQMSLGQSSLLGHSSRMSTDSEKQPSPDFHGHQKRSDDLSLGGVIQGFVQPSRRSEGAYEPNKSANSSPNMLELLHKVDRSRDSGNSANFSPDHNLSSEVLETEASDGSVGRLRQNHPSGTQNFGLQLAPPTQRLPVKTNNLFSRSSSQKNNTPSPHPANSERGEKGPVWLSSTAQSLPLHGTAQGELRPNNFATHSRAGDEASTYNRLGNYSAGLSSGSSLSGSQSQNKLYSGAGLQGTVNLSANISSDGLASQLKQTDDFYNISGHSPPVSLAESASVVSRGSLPAPAGLSQSEGIEHSHAKVSVQQFASPASQPFVPSITSHPGNFSTMSSNVWINDPTQWSMLGSQTHKGPFQSFHPSGDKQESTSSGPQSSDGQDILKGPSNLDGASPCFVNRDKVHNASPWQQVTSEKSELAQKSLESQEKESMPKNLPNASSKVACQKDMEAFGRSLKPNSLFHQKYSLLQQVQVMKSSEADPSNRGLKRFKGTDNSAEAQQLAPPRAGEQLPQGPNIVVGDASVQRASVQCGDSKILSFSSEPEDDKNKNASQPVHVHLPSQDMTGFGPRESQSDASSSVAGSLRAEHTRVSPQMAPSWFNQYGTFKNGQMFPIFDGRKVAAMKTLEQHYILGKSSDVMHTEQVNSATGPSQVGSVPESSSATTMDGAHLPSDALPPNVINGSLVPLRPRKRKSAATDLLPWHKEVAQGAQRLLNISVAEQDWALAANRVIERRIEDDVELIEDGPLMMLKSKRRLVLTTQLMQQLLKAPPAAILFSDARLNNDCVTYFLSRLALGDACSLASSGNDSSVPGDNINLFSEKSKASERVGDQRVSRVVEEFLDKVKMMENELLGLDKRASILDIRVECQDLEKFAVINRFAKFHGRGQHEGAESSSSDGVLNYQKSCPQRYVTALPMPRNLPDGVQCLSL